MWHVSLVQAFNLNQEVIYFMSLFYTSVILEHFQLLREEVAKWAPFLIHSKILFY